MQYLTEFKFPNSDGHLDGQENAFFPVLDNHQPQLEAAFGSPAPECLVSFWNNIGYGKLEVSRDRSKFAAASNFFLHPKSVLETLDRAPMRKKLLGKRVFMPFAYLGEEDLHAIMINGDDIGAVYRIGSNRRRLAASFESYVEQTFDDPNWSLRM